MNDETLLRIGLDELCRRSFFAFVLRFFPLVGSGGFEPNWHHELLCNRFERLLQGSQRRLLVTIAPRTLKSIIATVLFPAWALGRNPKLQVVCASYSQELGLKLARDSRAVMRDAAFQRIFPAASLSAERGAVHDFATTAGGGRRTVSVGGTFTGLGGDIIVCDDLMSAQDAASKVARDNAGAWMDHVMRTRLNNPAVGAIAIIAQRLHEDDPIGRILDREPDLWELVDLPAIAETREVHDLGRGRRHTREIDEVLEPKRMPRGFLDEQKRVIGTAAFNAQYQQQPTPSAGNMVLREWFRAYNLRTLTERLAIHQSWDVAMKADEEHDHSACITFGVQDRNYRHGNVYILDIYRGKLLYPDLRRKIMEHAARWGAESVLVEDKASGTGLIQDLRREGVVRPIPYLPRADKVTRLSLQSAKIEQGRVFLDPTHSEAEDFLAEILAFPNGRYDDQVDALTQFLDHLDEKAKRTVHRSHY